jgi:hypothetical protein
MLDRHGIPAFALSCMAMLTAAAGAARGDDAAAQGGHPAQIVVDATGRIAGIGAHQLGTNLGIWYNVTASALPVQIASVAPTVLRWPGGSLSDTYHWRNHTSCDHKGGGKYESVAAYDPNSTFDNFMRRIVIPGRYDAVITLNYGTNAECKGGGDPAEAAAWVAHAKDQGYNKYIHHWTVGNEVFGGWEVDLHQMAHDGATYAAAMSGSGGYYQKIKAADAAAQVGVLVGTKDWDAAVLKSAPYDFVELHWYPQQPGHESDGWLLDRGPAELESAIAMLRQELKDVGRPSTPIMLGEVNSVAFDPGKQSMSIVSALFTGMIIGEVLKHDIAVMTWWFGAGGTQLCNKNGAGQYGWQSFGGYDLVATNTQYGWNYCTSHQSHVVVPEGTVFPAGNAFAMAQVFARPGGSILDVRVDRSLPDVRAYAATQADGYALMLFNLSEQQANPVTIAMKNTATRSFTAATLTYDRTQYDETKRNVWRGPVSASLGKVDSQATRMTLPPWSMTVLTLK